jgi:hypothetical protein
MRTIYKQLPLHHTIRLKDNAVIKDLKEAASVVTKMGRNRPHWVEAERAILQANKNPLLVVRATEVLEEALRGDGFID